MPDNDALKIQIKEALKARYFSMIQAPATITEAEQQEKNRLEQVLSGLRDSETRECRSSSSRICRG